MKNKTNFLKDIAISILFVLSIIIILITIFYDKLVINKTVSIPQEYEIEKEIIEEVKKEEEEQQTDIITTYEVDASNLKSYEGTKKSDYDKDKKDPFERYTYIGQNPDSNEVSDDTDNQIEKNEVYEEEIGIK